MNTNITDTYEFIGLIIIMLSLFILSVLFGYFGKKRKNNALKKYGIMLFSGFTISFYSIFLLKLGLHIDSFVWEDWWYLFLFCVLYFYLALKLDRKFKSTYSRFFN